MKATTQILPLALILDRGTFIETNFAFVGFKPQYFFRSYAVVASTIRLRDHDYLSFVPLDMSISLTMFRSCMILSSR